MDLEMFLRSIDVLHLTALVTDPEKKDSVLRMRDGNTPEILLAYSPKIIKGDVSGFGITEIPDSPEIQARLRRWIGEYVSEDVPDFPGANAFHMSHPVFWKRNENISDLGYTITFYKLK